jgi:cardiolipin synthase A/B
VTRLCDVVTTAVGIPPHPGNRAQFLRNGDEIFPAMLQAIDDAEHRVEMLTFVYWTGGIARRMAAALSAAARRGVDVRVLLDAIGARSMDRHLVDVMERAGCDVRMFRPPLSRFRLRSVEHRTHRKILVCDETVGFTGGVGIAAEWEGDARNPDEWRDTHFRVTGPAVRQMEASFIEHWVECGHPSFAEDDRFPDLDDAGDTEVLVLRGSSGPFWHDVGLTMDALLRCAERQIHLTTAYFAPGERMLRLLCDAVERGVEVVLLLPGTHLDNRVVHLASSDEYERLMECGVQIHHYERTMLHTKCLTVDGEVALVGSANIDERSMRHNEEIALAIFDPDVVATLDEHFAEDLTHAEEIDLERWRDRPIWKKWLEAAVNPIEDLL